MHKFAFGSLGLTPYEYYTMTPYEFFATCEGFFDKIDREEALHRKVSFIAALTHGAKIHRPQELWELWLDKSNENAATEEQKRKRSDAEIAAVLANWKRIKEKHGVN